MPWRRTFGVWLLLAVLMTGNGIAREAALVPSLGRAAADALSAILGIAIVLTVTGVALRPLAGRADARPGRTAIVWIATTVGFELVVGRTVDGRSWGELLANYALWRGRLWPVVLAVVGLAPFLWTRWLAPRARASLAM